MVNGWLFSDMVVCWYVGGIDFIMLYSGRIMNGSRMCVIEMYMFMWLNSSVNGFLMMLRFISLWLIRFLVCSSIIYVVMCMRMDV